MTPALRVEPVVDLADPRLVDYRNLKDAVLLRERGRFIVEGRGNLRVLLADSSHRPESLLLGEAAFDALRETLLASGIATPIFVAPQRVLDAIVGFSIHRGALAVCLRPAPLAPQALLQAIRAREPSPIVVVVEDVSDADNVGAIFRNAMALGARAVLLAGRTCDPLYRKAVRTSMGGVLRVPFARAPGIGELAAALAEAGFELLALDPKGEAVALASALAEGPRGPTALMVGAEGDGLSAAALATSSRRLRIPMEAGVDSLNVATALAIALHALRSRADPGTREGSGRTEGTGLN